MKCLFFDHSFHRQTRSSDFFVSLLSDVYDVDVTYIDPDNPSINKELVDHAKRCEIVVFWQIMPDAKLLIGLDLSKVVLIPMYDACCILSYRKWLEYKKCRFISFSKRMHNHLTAMGLKSFYLQYAPDVFSLKDDHKDIFPTIFIWKRTPNFNFKKLLPVLKKNGIKKAICHGFKEEEKCEYQGMELEFTTGWFKDNADYFSTLSRCHYFLAPRQFVGIGMGFLEAMSQGLCVIAPNESTMNEYINKTNGVLFNSFGGIKIDLNSYVLMSNCARETIFALKEKWEKSAEDIISYLQDDVLFPESRNFLMSSIIREELYQIIHIRIRNFLRRHLGIQDY